MTNKGKGPLKRKIGLINYESYVPNAVTFKTVQLRVGGWVARCHFYNQREFDKEMSKVRFHIKRILREWSVPNSFHEQTIVDIDVSDVNTKSRRSDYQYSKIDVVLFTKNMKYDRKSVEVISKEVTENIIDVLKHYPNTWTFVKSPKRNL